MFISMVFAGHHTTSGTASWSLILLLRVAKVPVEVAGFTIEPGKLVGATPAISNRIAESFPHADVFIPERYLDPRNEDIENPASPRRRKSSRSAMTDRS